MRIDEFEEAVLALEEIVIRIRAPVGAEVDEYDYMRQASGTSSVTDWLHKRIYPRLGDYEVCIIDGTWRNPHGRTKLDTLRSSYDR